jgi:hypothetical protein
MTQWAVQRLDVFDPGKRKMLLHVAIKDTRLLALGVYTRL